MILFTPVRQTDRRTDRILIARPRLHYMQRGKNKTAATPLKILSPKLAKGKCNLFEQKRTSSFDLSTEFSLPDHVIVCCGCSFPGIPCETWNHKDIPATVISNTCLKRKDYYYYCAHVYLSQINNSKLQPLILMNAKVSRI